MVVEVDELGFGHEWAAGFNDDATLYELRSVMADDSSREEFYMPGETFCRPLPRSVEGKLAIRKSNHTTAWMLIAWKGIEIARPAVFAALARLVSLTIP